jgi:hypothetical protein
MKYMFTLLLLATCMLTSCLKDNAEENKPTVCPDPLSPKVTWSQVAIGGGYKITDAPANRPENIYKISFHKDSFQLFKDDALLARGTYHQKEAPAGVTAQFDFKGIPNDFQPGYLIKDTLYLGSSAADGPIYIFAKPIVTAE